MAGLNLVDLLASRGGVDGGEEDSSDDVDGVASLILRGRLLGGRTVRPMVSGGR